MKWFLGLVTFSLFSFAAPTQPTGQGLSGNYELGYLASDLAVGFNDSNGKLSKVHSFNFKRVAPPPIPEPFYLFHEPKGPSATVIGAGSPSPRLCEGESTLFSQTLECSPLSSESWIDEETQCGIKKVFVETILYSIIEDLRYARTEILTLDKATEEACQAYKNKIVEQLDKDQGPDFFKAIKRAGLFKDLDAVPDIFILTHFYQATPTNEKAVETSKDNQTGAYALRYAGRSKSFSWVGTEKRDLRQSEVFNASDISIAVQPLDNILFFHDPEKHSVRVAGGGLNRLRKCELESRNKEEEIFVCTLFKANEEELGTGCAIEHWIQEKITLAPQEGLKYERLEQRHLLDSTLEGCENYRQKMTQEIQEGTAEAFFRVLAQTGGLNPQEKLGDTFQLAHEYTVKADN